MPSPCPTALARTRRFAPIALALAALAARAGAQELAFSERALAVGLELTHACAPGAEGLCEMTGGGAVGDFDRDGWMDLVVLSNGGRLQFFRNELAGARAGWLRVTLDTSARRDPAPDGFGARVVARIAGRELHRTLDGGNNYLTTSEPVLHFGLGSATVVDELEVVWPDGSRWTRASVAANQHIVVRAR